MALPTQSRSLELASSTSRHAARLVRDGYLPRAGDEVDEADAAPTFTARRQYRERRPRGVFVVPVEVTCAMAQALFDHG